MSNTSKDDFRKIPFKNVGRRQQHEITLFGLAERPFDLEVFIKECEQKQSFAEELITDCYAQSILYLKEKGFEDLSGLFQVVNGKVVRWNEGDNLIDAMPLWAAIKERDEASGGLTGECLAAMICNRCQMLRNSWPPTHKDCSAVLDVAMKIQYLHFQFYLLEKVQPQYSVILPPFFRQ